MKRLLEICCTNIESALIAQQGGANRIELCANIFEGGTTPSDGTIKAAIENLNIDVYVLIRPRGGDFVYSNQDFEIMLHDIERSLALGAKGIVSGVLNPDYTIDIPRTAQLVEAATSAKFTFHRAFDLVADQLFAVDQLKKLAVDCILTSGGQSNVALGSKQLKALLKRADVEIGILAGGGLTSSNIDSLLEVGCSAFHTTAKQWVTAPTETVPCLNMNGSRDIPENSRMLASLEEIQLIRSKIDEFE